MSWTTFGNNVIQTLSQEELDAVLSFISGVDGDPVQATMLVDSTQYLTLGGISQAEVLGAAIKQANAVSNPSLALESVYDVVTANSIAYARHLDKVVIGLNDHSNITKAMVFSGKYLKMREQLRVISSFVDKNTGNTAFRVARRFQSAAFGVPTGWTTHQKINGVPVPNTLVAKPSSKGGYKYLLNGTVVKLADPTVQDQAIEYVGKQHVIERYNEVINTPSVLEQVQSVANEQQLVFYTVMKTLKPLLIAEFEAQQTQE